MKKVLIYIVMISLIVFLAVEMQLPCAKADYAVWYVDDDGPADFHTIQEAINTAADGDIIEIQSGTYSEHVVVNKSVLLLGEEDFSCIVDGGYSQDVITVVADYVTLNYLTIQNCGEYYGGVFINQCTGIEVVNSLIRDNDGGIILSESHNVIVSRNIIETNSWDGIAIRESSACSILDNTISRNGNNGLTILESSGIAVQNNTISENSCGLYVYSSDSITVFNNAIVSNQQQVTSSPNLANTWNQSYPQGGNFWSDYTGADSNQDGIGDTQYAIDENNTDCYPLMGTFHSFITLQSHIVEVISNSTILDFIHFESNNTIRMHVTNTTAAQTFGFIRITIPHALMNGTYAVTIKGAEPFTINNHAYDNGSHRWIHFTYRHSTLEVVIIPELQNPHLILLLMATMLLAMKFQKRRFSRS